MDDGHAADRTTLAWRRTALAVVTGAAVVARLRFSGLEPDVLLAGVALVLLGFGVVLARPSRRERDGRAAALVVAATVALASLELVRLSILTGG